MKKVYLVHGWGGSSGYFNVLNKQLNNLKINSAAFNMPNSENPKIDAWVGHLKNNIKNLNGSSYFIGHSIGCQAILRFLEMQNKRIGGAILIAPWMHLDMKTIEEEGEQSVKIAKPWMETPINFNKIKKLSNNFLCFFSDNDPYVPLSDIQLFKENLNARVIIEKGMGHIDDISKIDSKILEFFKK